MHADRSVAISSVHPLLQRASQTSSDTVTNQRPTVILFYIHERTVKSLSYDMIFDIVNSKKSQGFLSELSPSGWSTSWSWKYECNRPT